MRHTKIAAAKPFEGKPGINMPACYGSSPGKPILFRIPVTGQRPITYKAVNLPEGLALSGGIVTGQIAEEGDYPITLIAENKLGFCENGKKVIHVLKKKLHNGDYALAVFNLGETVETVKVYLDEKTEIRDVWAKEDLAAAETVVLEEMHPHTVRMFRMKRC